MCLHVEDKLILGPLFDKRLLVEHLGGIDFIDIGRRLH